jgi:hypothetical protein
MNTNRERSVPMQWTLRRDLDERHHDTPLHRQEDWSMKSTSLWFLWKRWVIGRGE